MKIGVLTGGGDCPGLNATIRSIVFRASDYNYEVVGIKDGWAGLIEAEKMDLDIPTVDELMNRGGTILGTSRVNPYKRDKGVEKVLDNINKLGLSAVIAIGGEDTLGVAYKLYKDFKINIVGIPKTMDNDLSATDYTFGFFSATEVATEAIERLRDTAKSHSRIIVLEVMGRYAGWVALFAGLAGGADWILIPEKEVDLEAMYEHIKYIKNRKNYAIIVVSEGIKLPEAIKKEEKMKTDEFGHVLLKEQKIADIIAEQIEKNTGYETRSAVIGHIQRGGNPTLFDKILSLRYGVAAVDLIHNNEYGYMVCLKGNQIEKVPLSEAVKELKLVDDYWYNLMKIFCK